MKHRAKAFFQYIRISTEIHNDRIIDATILAQIWFCGTVALIYTGYTLIIAWMEYAIWRAWLPQTLYGLVVAGVAAISWALFKTRILPKKYTILVSNSVLFLLLMLLAIARGLGGIYISYGLAVCTTVATAMLDVNPLHYRLFAVTAAVCESMTCLTQYWENISSSYGVVLYNTLDAMLLLVVSLCVNMYICVLRYRVWDEARALEKESATDPMTGLYNRKYFERYVLFHHRDDEVAALLHMDLDNFKTLNDTLGHQYGDALLVQVAELLRVGFRKTDCVARVGGDEFMVFMPGLSERKHAIERVQALLGQFPIIVEEEGKSVPVSISIGVTFSEDDQFPSYQELYEQADQAMYQAKKAGKRQAFIAGGGSIRCD